MVPVQQFISWLPSGTLSDPHVAAPTAAPTVSTTYTLTGTSIDGCVKTDTVHISVFNNPSVPTISRGHDSLRCVQTASAYQWYRDGTAIPGAINQLLIFTLNGNYYVQVFNAQGCSTSSVIINVNDVGISEISENAQITVYPNPTSDLISLELNSSKEDNFTLDLMNATGELIASTNLSHFSGTVIKKFDLRGMANGIYFIEIISNDKVFTKKVMKQ